MYKHTGVGDVVGMEISDFKVISGLWLGKLFARNAFHFAKRAVRKKNFIAVLQVAGGDPLLAQARIACMLQGSAVLPTILYRKPLLLSRQEKRMRKLTLSHIARILLHKTQIPFAVLCSSLLNDLTRGRNFQQRTPARTAICRRRKHHRYTLKI